MKKLNENNGQFRVTVPKKIVDKFGWQTKMPICIERVRLGGEVGIFIKEDKELELELARSRIRIPRYVKEYGTKPFIPLKKKSSKRDIPN